MSAALAQGVVSMEPCGITASLGCVVATPTDVDLDGCTGVGDVLEVLATFGQCYDDSENEEDGIGGE